MRYLILPILLSTVVACGDDNAKPKKRYDDDDQNVSYDQMLDMEQGGDVGGNAETSCSPLECDRDKLIDMVDVEKNFEFAMLGGIEIEPEPFEFRFDMGE